MMSVVRRAYGVSESEPQPVTCVTPTSKASTYSGLSDGLPWRTLSGSSNDGNGFRAYVRGRLIRRL